MTIRVAIVADDLTGALDTATPFALAGHSVVVAVTPEATGEAVRSGAAVVAVATGSRASHAAEAADIARHVTSELMAGRPDIVMKKVDSRLKGNVGAESAAVASASGRPRILVSPAVPDQQRRVANGQVIGRGIDAPIAIAALFDGLGTAPTVVDAAKDGDLDRLVAGTDWSRSLAVGARGLGQAFARLLGAGSIEAAVPPSSARTLFALGSRDPITEAQIERLLASGRLAGTIDAPGGGLDGGCSTDLPLLLRCTGPLDEHPQVVAGRFGAGVSEILHRRRPDLAVLGGGDTALAVLRAAGIGLVFPKGELAPGVPWFRIALRDGTSIACSVKSGGFGGPDSLVGLLPPEGGIGRPMSQGAQT